MKIVFDEIVKETHTSSPGSTTQIEPYVQGEINIEAMDKIDLFEWHDGQLNDLESIQMCFRHQRIRITIAELEFVEAEAMARRRYVPVLPVHTGHQAWL